MLMTGPLTLEFHVPGDDFTRAGEASSSVKNTLKQIGFPSDVIRKVAISLYEGEINMFIHAGGGDIRVRIYPDHITLVLEDHGPGIPDIDLAMQAGYSTAPSHVRNLGFGAGMGLPNMKNYSDDLKIKSMVGVGTKVTMIIYNPQETIEK